MLQLVSKKNKTMKTPEFFYLLRIRLIRNIENPSDLIDIRETFIEPDPIMARERAFYMYQNYVDVLLESKGEKYMNFDETQHILKDFYDMAIQIKATENDTEFVYNVSEIKPLGIFIYLIQSESPLYINNYGQLDFRQKTLIHSLANYSRGYKYEVMDNLYQEYKLYQKYNYDCSKYITEINSSHYSTHSSGGMKTLATPLIEQC